MKEVSMILLLIKTLHDVKNILIVFLFIVAGKNFSNKVRMFYSLIYL